MRDIILNETTKAAALLTGAAKVEDVRAAISLLARYDIQAAGIDKPAARSHLRKTIRKLYPAVPAARIDTLVDHYVEHGDEYPLLDLGSVPITKRELDVVCAREGIRAKCLTFALLALAKFDTMRFPGVDYWYNGERWNELSKRANLILSEDDMCYMLHDLYKDNYIGLATRIDNCSMHVLFADPDGDPVMMLNEQDYQDLGYCLRAYLGEKYTRCEECGRWIKQNNRGKPRRFCTDCAADNQRASNSAYMRRIRQ